MNLTKLFNIIYKLIKNTLIGLIILIISITIISTASVYTIIKCNKSDQIICKNMKLITDRCLQTDLINTLKPLEDMVNFLYSSVDLKANAQDNNSINEGRAFTAFNIFGNRIYCEEHYQKLLDKITNLRSAEAKEICKSTIEPNGDKTGLNNIEKCNKICDEIGYSIVECNDTFIDDNIDVDLTTIADSKEGETSLNHLLEKLRYIPNQYIKELLVDPFNQIYESIKVCGTSLNTFSCIKDAIGKQLDIIKNIFINFVTSIIDGIGDRLKEEIQQLFDFPKMIEEILKGVIDTIKNIGNYVKFSDEELFGFRIPKGFNIDGLWGEITKPIDTIKSIFQKFTDPKFFESIILSKTEELLDFVDSPIEIQVKVIGNTIGQQLADKAIIFAQSAIAISTGGATSGTILLRLTKMIEEIAIKIPLLKKGLDLSKIYLKKGYTLYNNGKDKLNITVSKLKNSKIVAKLKDITDSLSKIKDKGVQAIEDSLDSLFKTFPSLAKNDLIKKKIIATSQKALDSVTCGPLRLKANIVDKITQAEPQQYDFLSFLTPTAKAQSNTNQDTLNIAQNSTKTKHILDSSKEPYKCVVIEAEPNQEDNGGVCEGDVEVGKDSSFNYRNEFRKGIESDVVLKRELLEFYDPNYQHKSINAIMCGRSVNHRIPPGWIKKFNLIEATKKYLFSKGVMNINNPAVTELLTHNPTNLKHSRLWESCLSYVKNSVDTNVISQCLKTIECDNIEYINLIKNDPYYIRYSNKLDKCTNIKYPIFNKIGIPDAKYKIK
jgi:hypothetical protein